MLPQGKPDARKWTNELKVPLKGGKRERELMTQLNYPPPRGVKLLVGMSTGGKVQEERGGAQINEYLFW